MEYLYRNIELNDYSSIIGDRDQILQIILKRNDSVTLKRQNLYYMSSSNLEETLYNKKPIKDENIGKKVKDNNLIKLRNQDNNFEYVGIYNGGKIMKISPLIYNDLFIRYDCLLAFTEHMELLEVDEVKSKIEKFHKANNFLQRDHKFVMLYSDKVKSKEIDNFSLADYPSLKEYAYLCNENILVEKRLGINEDIAIKNNSLVCFERTVSFHKIEPNPKHKLINKNEFFIAEGPGLIIFELNNQNTKKLDSINRLKYTGLICLIFSVLIIAHILVEDYRPGFELGIAAN